MADDPSAESWFRISIEEAQYLLSLANQTWPFLNITQDQFFQLHGTMLDKNFVPSTMRVYGSTISILGTLFTVLLVGTLWKKAVSEKNGFYQAMLIIAILDLVFHIFNLVYIFAFRKFRAEGYWNPAVMWILLYMAGTTFAISLASDMCAVVLTSERYLAVAYPQAHLTLLERYKGLATVAVICVILLTSATRLHHPLEHQVSHAGPSLYVYTASGFGETTFGVALSLISDMILPFSLSALMILISIPFLISIAKRKRKRVADKARVQDAPKGPPADGRGPLFTQRPTGSGHTAKAQTAKNDQRAIVVLTLSLDALFLLNQLGYCAYCIVGSVASRHEVSYGSTYEEVAAWIFYTRLESYASTASDIAECLSHALNFLVYMALSGSMRRDFMTFLIRLL